MKPIRLFTNFEGSEIMIVSLDTPIISLFSSASMWLFAVKPTSKSIPFIPRKSSSATLFLTTFSASFPEF